MTAPTFGIFDADDHYYEPRDSFRHLDPKLADRAVRIVTDNLFGRFPELEVATIECGAGWVTHLLPRLDKAQRSCTKHSPWVGGRLQERACVGPERGLFGSDWRQSGR